MKRCVIPLHGLIEFPQAEGIALRVRLALRGGVQDLTFSCDEATEIHCPGFLVFLEGVRRHLDGRVHFSGVRGNTRQLLTLFNFTDNLRS